MRGSGDGWIVLGSSIRQVRRLFHIDLNLDPLGGVDDVCLPSPLVVNYQTRACSPCLHQVSLAGVYRPLSSMFLTNFLLHRVENQLVGGRLDGRTMRSGSLK